MYAIFFMSIMCAAKTSLTARERFDLYLRSNHKRRTAERFAIMDRVLKAPGHVSADELCRLMKDDGYPVSAATVYSTLELLVDCGLLVRQRFNDKASLYEKATGTTSAHHHLICTCCGKIKEVRDTALNDLIATRHFTGFTQSYYSLNIYGICGSCGRRRRKKEKDK